MRKTFYVAFAQTTATRTSEKDYLYATCKREKFGWKIAFHTSFAAASRRAGKYGTIAPVERVK